MLKGVFVETKEVEDIITYLLDINGRIEEALYRRDYEDMVIEQLTQARENMTRVLKKFDNLL